MSAQISDSKELPPAAKIPTTFQHRGFARTGRTHDRDEARLRDIERDIVECTHLELVTFVDPAHVINLNCEFLGHRPAPPFRSKNRATPRRARRSYATVCSACSLGTSASRRCRPQLARAA